MPSRVAEKKSVWRRLGAVDGGPEAHVEHAVGLVEDEDAKPHQRDGAARDQVLETAGGGDEDVGPTPCGDLWAEADAAVDGGNLQAPCLGEGGELVDDLPRELPGGSEDESLRALVLRLDQVDKRDAEGERLARTGRRLDEEVVTRERVADDHLLYGERTGDRARGKGVDHLFRGAEIGKGSDVVLLLSCDLGRSCGPKAPIRHVEETEPLERRIGLLDQATVAAGPALAPHAAGFAIKWRCSPSRQGWATSQSPDEHRQAESSLI